MFNFLKKTVKKFVDGLTGKDPIEEAKQEEKIEKTETNFPIEPTESPQEVIEREAEIITEETAPAIQEPVIQKVEKKSIEDEIYEEAVKEVQKELPIKQEEVAKKIHKPEQKQVQETKIREKILEEAKPEPIVEKKEVKKEKFEVKEEKKDLKPKLGIFTQIKSAFTNKVTITEKETEPVFTDLEIALLESDVSFDTAQFLIADLKKRLVGKQVGKNELQSSIQEEIRNSFEEILKQSENTSFITELKKAQKPVKILFLGPNGAGKTTTIAKLSYLLKQEGLTSVISASDTFRAAAIEQASIHGEKLGVKVVKHQYGSDPSAVAFDAIEHAKSKGIDVVLIDTAGRQETNQNLLREMEKINRVINPDYKIFIGEAVAGHAVIEQAKAFHEKVKLDGVILTKLDCDAKGGTSLSLAHDLNVPILFIGLGQEYSDLKEFDADFILKNIIE